MATAGKFETFQSVLTERVEAQELPLPQWIKEILQDKPLDLSNLRQSSSVDENLLQSALDLSLGRRFIFQQDNDPKHTAKIIKEGLRDNSVNVLEWPSQSPDLNLTEHLWRDLNMAVHRRSPSNLMELERSCKEEWEKLPKNRRAKLVASYLKDLRL